MRTDHILFIASGAFHLAKPSDLIPELQGRLPIRVELKALTPDDFKRILTEPDASLVQQYHSLMAAEGRGTDRSPTRPLTRIAEIAWKVNETTENIGARRLHTVLERLLENISFDAGDRVTGAFEVTPEYVDRASRRPGRGRGPQPLYPLTASHCRAPAARPEPAMNDATAPRPHQIKLRQRSRVLELEYGDGIRHALPFELLRVYSPSAEVRGHGMGDGVLQTGKKDVDLVDVDPVGNYALKLSFDDGHDSGLYSWAYLYDLGKHQDTYWTDYLQRLQDAGGSREPFQDP